MSVIDEVKNRVDIVELVSETVTLQRAGRNFKARCPFHNEKTPSFSVAPDRQTWHCFGACGSGGDVFNFVMRRDDIEFGEALRLLAQRAGVSLGERRDPQEDERQQRLLQANESAAAYFHHTLLHAKPAEAARSYLASRGLDADTIEMFQLGYGLESWDALKSHLTERNFTQDELVTAGLLVESERGGYDRFRDRLVFPIRNERGQVAGFGARLLASPQESNADAPSAKYINTPQTPLFDKSALLYGLDRAKEAIRSQKSVVVVEGYMDVIAAHQHSISNVVASMGTALTERQIKALERLRSKILLALDADAAGIEATLRALQEAAETGAIRTAPESAHPAELEDDEFTEKVREWSRSALKRAAVNFYVVPLSGKDPDEMIRADRSAWDTAVASAKPFYDHVFEVVAARKDLSQPSQRAELLQELLPVVRLIEEPAQRAHYVQRLASKAKVGEKVVWAELQRPPARSTRRSPPTSPETAPIARVQQEPQEEFCLALLLREPELRTKGLALDPELFLLGQHRAIFAAWQQAPDPDSMRQALPHELHPYLEEISKRNLPFFAGSSLHSALEDCVRRIQLRRLSAAKQASAAALTDPDVQAQVGAAVQEAYALWQTEAGVEAAAGSAQGDASPTEFTQVWWEDMKTGKELHRAARGASSEARQESPQVEGEP